MEVDRCHCRAREECIYLNVLLNVYKVFMESIYSVQLRLPLTAICLF